MTRTLSSLGMWWAFLAVVSVGSHYIGLFFVPLSLSLSLSLTVPHFAGKTVAFNMGWWAFTCTSIPPASPSRASLMPSQSP